MYQEDYIEASYDNSRKKTEIDQDIRLTAE